MTRRRRSRQWHQAHVADPWVRRSRASGLRSRAAFKLEELDQRERLLGRGRVVLDLGAAPGGWSQVAAQRVQPGGRVVAVDRLAMDPLPGVIVVRGDLSDPALAAQITDALGGRADLVISDMAPDISGVAARDAAAVLAIAELFCRACVQHLRADGVAVCKVFAGETFGEIQDLLKATFREVRVRKPAASRDRSRETYLVCRGLVPA